MRKGSTPIGIMSSRQAYNSSKQTFWGSKNLQEVKTGQDSFKDSWHQLRKGFTEAQLLVDRRYHELKTSIEDLSSKMATKDQLNQVLKSLSQDITFMFGDHHRLKKRVSILKSG